MCLCILYVCLLCCTHTLSVHAAHTHFNFVFHVHQHALGLTHTRNHTNRVRGGRVLPPRGPLWGSDTLRMQMYSYYHSHFYILNLCGSVIIPPCIPALSYTILRSKTRINNNRQTKHIKSLFTKLVHLTHNPGPYICNSCAYSMQQQSWLCLCSISGLCWMLGLSSAIDSKTETL